MHLYLIRHAHALPLNPPEIAADEDRPLSAQGHAQVTGLAATIGRLGIHLDQVLTSPLIRAQQTAEGLRRQLGLDAGRMRRSELLAPGMQSKKLANRLCKLAAEHVALVGHEPDLSRFLAWLIGGKLARIDLAKAGLACVVCDEPPGKGAGRLAWLVTPAWCAGEKGSQTPP